MAENDQVIDFRELGASGLKRFSGFIYDEFLPELTGWRGIQLYKEMNYNDPIVGSVLFAIRMLCRRVPWRVKPASEQPFDLEAAEFIESCMNDMSRSWLDVVDEVLQNVLPYGHAPDEIVYKRRTGPSVNPSMNSKYSDGRIGWRKIEVRAPDTVWRWQFDDHGGIQGLFQLAPPHYYNTFIPIKKLLLFRTTVDKNNPEGRSVLRNAFRPWYMKKNLENIEAIGMERDLAGLPIAEVPPELLSKNASNDQKALAETIRQIVTNIRRDEQEGVLWPMQYTAEGKQMYNLKLLSTGGQRQFDTDKVIQRYDTRIAMTLLADFIMLGHNAGGNRSIVEKRADLFTTAIGAYLDIIADVVNRHGIPRLMELNPDMQISNYPEIAHGDLESMDIDVIGTFIQKLAAAGAPLFPNPDLEKWLMKIAHAPEPVDPMKVAQGLEIQPRKTVSATNVTVIPADPVEEPSGTVYAADMPTPGMPPVNPPPSAGASPQNLYPPAVTPGKV